MLVLDRVSLIVSEKIDINSSNETCIVASQLLEHLRGKDMTPL